MHLLKRTTIIRKSLLAKEYEGILQKYIDSEHPNAGVLQLIWQSQSSAECPISDQLRLNAKRRSREVFSTLSGVTTSFGIGVSIAPIKGLIEVENKGNNDILYNYSLLSLLDLLLISSIHIQFFVVYKNLCNRDHTGAIPLHILLPQFHREKDYK